MFEKGVGLQVGQVFEKGVDHASFCLFSHSHATPSGIDHASSKVFS